MGPTAQRWLWKTWEWVGACAGVGPSMEDDEGAGEDCGTAGMGSGVEGKTLEDGGNWQRREGGSGHRGSVACPELCGGHGPGSCGYFRGSGTHPLSGRNQPWGRQEVLGAFPEGAGGLLAGEGCPGAGSPPPSPSLHPPTSLTPPPLPRQRALGSVGEVEACSCGVCMFLAAGWARGAWEHWSLGTLHCQGL